MNNFEAYDYELLESIKHKVAEASGLSNPDNWMQKDYDFLVYFIEDKTGVRLSLSTIKRIYKNKYSRLPHISTLNALSQIAYGTDWLPQKKQWLEKLEKQSETKLKSVGESTKSRRPKVWMWGVPLLIILILGIFLFLNSDKGNVVDYDPDSILFSYEKSVDGVVPNTVVFSYDVSTVEADTFFIQQSWDTQRRVQIFKENDTKTDIYYTPGFYYAKLIADDKIIKEIPVHITYSDWFIAARQAGKELVTFNDDKQFRNDSLGLKKSVLDSSKIDVNDKFNLIYYNSREFDVSGDNFSFSTSFKMGVNDNEKCPSLAIILKGEEGYFMVMSCNKGCESNLQLQFADKSFNGKDNDFTMLGTDLYNWQNMNILVEDKNVEIRLNDVSVFKSSYSKPVGNLKEITYIFNGLGMIDDVDLKDREDVIKFQDYFNNTSSSNKH